MCVPIGEWVLVTAAAGGVGIAAVQIAKGALSFSLVINLCILSCFLSSSRQRSVPASLQQQARIASWTLRSVSVVQTI